MTNKKKLKSATTQVPYLYLQSLISTQQSEAWTTIAQALKQGPALQTMELMKFSGDPMEYAEFVTNFQVRITLTSSR